MVENFAEDIDPADTNWEQQEEEIESLTYIYPEEMTVTKEKPYQVEVVINSNTESEERNFLKVKIIFDLQNEYPDIAPYIRIRNLAPDYCDNKFLDRVEMSISAKTEELLGSFMIFEVCDMVREKISSINDEVLEKIDAMNMTEEQKVATQHEAKKTDDNVTFTPVTKESFAIWCETYMAKLKEEAEAKRTAADDKPTGRQLFEMNRQAFEDVDFAEDEPKEETKEETKEQEVEFDEEGEDFTYDAALYEGVEDLDEDVDFD